MLQTVPLGFQWAAADPFLFCVHHLDRYPAGNAELGPSASLAGRQLGQDFEGIDGWRMYHGQVVPGFPAHPHRGFETITYVRQGLIDHSDSMGAAARFGRGDVQWMTAGSGVVHSEMFPLSIATAPTRPSCSRSGSTSRPPTRWSSLTSRCCGTATSRGSRSTDDEGRTAVVTVIAGRLGEIEPASPPPVVMGHQARVRPGDLAHRARSRCRLDDPARGIGGDARARCMCSRAALTSTASRSRPPPASSSTPSVRFRSGPASTRRSCCCKHARLGEPVAQYGPFVMNTRDEIEQAFADYQRTRFGGWPWDRDDPVHGIDQARFARHADGRLDAPSGSEHVVG